MWKNIKYVWEPLCIDDPDSWAEVLLGEWAVLMAFWQGTKIGDLWCLPTGSEIVHLLAVADFAQMPWPAPCDYVNGPKKQFSK